MRDEVLLFAQRRRYRLSTGFRCPIAITGLSARAGMTTPTYNASYFKSGSPARIEVVSTSLVQLPLPWSFLAIRCLLLAL
jgi:hypothetical protein